MKFHSILFRSIHDAARTGSWTAPAFFNDLNLDQFIDAVTAGRQEYNLVPFFTTPLSDVDAVRYRHEIMRDLEKATLFRDLKSFAHEMRTIRQYLGMIDKIHYTYHKEGWFLETIGLYCETIHTLARNLARADIRSRGLKAFCEYVADYIASDGFKDLLCKTDEIKLDLSTVRYSLLIEDSSVTVCRYEQGTDYSAEVEHTFERFKQGAVKDYRVTFPVRMDMNHVEAKILDFVALYYPDIFMRLGRYYDRNSGFLDEIITTFDREIQFYLAYLEYIEPLRRSGLKFCCPEITTSSKEVFDYEGFDLVLAHKLLAEKSPVVCNDFYLKDKERIIVVSGPNQGGKTTFARTFGQLHYLAGIGCPVPGSRACLFLADRIFTHFEREESTNHIHGKLQDDLVRVSEILRDATPRSVIIMNEIFTSTTLSDATLLSRKILERIVWMDTLCVCVTFIDELASFSEKTVSMVSTVPPSNPSLRTFKIVRRPADGLSYAISITEKYGLTYDRLWERIPS